MSYPQQPKYNCLHCNRSVIYCKYLKYNSVDNLKNEVMSLPIQIKNWLNERGISDKIIGENKIDWNGSSIVIPVFDINGRVIFNKYRRDPFGNGNEPKYKYDAGASVQLYNAHKLAGVGSVVICEGELDAMRLETEGWLGVSGTGGAGTFRDEWLPLFAGKEVFACYDNDEAGMKGATKLLTKLPAKLVIIPREADVKDVTDYFKKHTFDDFHWLLAAAESWPVLSEPVPELKYIKDYEALIKKYKYHLELLLVRERAAKNTGKPFLHYDYIRQLLLNAINNLQRQIRNKRYLKKPAVEGDNGRITADDVVKAKEVPIEGLFSGQLRKVGNKMTGCCPFHSESNSSFTIYLDQNKFYCFGCSAGNDAIDFVMKRDQINFIEAVKKLLNK